MKSFVDSVLCAAVLSIAIALPLAAASILASGEKQTERISLF